MEGLGHVGVRPGIEGQGKGLVYGMVLGGSGCIRFRMLVC